MEREDKKGRRDQGRKCGKAERQKGRKAERRKSGKAQEG
jgi:hypothetical protein